jgi:hypothetical protein
MFAFEFCHSLSKNTIISVKLDEFPPILEEFFSVSPKELIFQTSFSM